MSADNAVPRRPRNLKPLATIIPKDDNLYVADVPYFAATSEGWMMNIPTLFGTAHIISEEAPPTLPKFDQLFHFGKKKLPVHIITQAHDFFRRIWTKQKTESSAFITYNDETDDYKLFIPEQYVTGSSVNHKLEPGAIKDGYRAVGTIHSHCDFSAFHSGTDEHDMEGMPGIHITLGKVNQDQPEIAIALSVNKVKFDPVEYDSIVDKERITDKNGYSTAPEWWDEFVKTGHAPWTGGTSWTTKTPKHNRKTHGRYPSNWDWSSWDADDYAATTPKYRHNNNWQLQQAKSRDAFKEFADEIEMSEAIMNYEVDRLAMYGFAATFNIRYAPATAEMHLKRKKGVQQMHLEDLADENRT